MLRPGEITVDFFAGGGGASQGIERAIGRPVDVAINHDAEAIAMHAANHPNTLHIQESVWKVDCEKFLRGKKVGLAWFSPDCKHFSRAKGTKPVNKNIRSLAWVVTWFVKKCKQLTRNKRGPRIIVLENVREFEDWGPLVPCWQCKACHWKGTEGQAKLARAKRACPRCDSRRLAETDQELPDPSRKGLTFRRFVGQIRGLGYAVEWKVLNAADYGAPTHRRRLFLVARNDGEPIAWPDPSHGDPKKIGQDLFSDDLKPWRTAAECIDWSIPCPSIFDRKKPLADKTLRRIALGIKRYVLDNPKPFIVGVGGRMGQGNVSSSSVDSPLGTVTAKNDRAVVSPVVVPVTHHGERRAHSPEEPLPTVTGANRGEFAAVLPHLTKFRTGAVGSGVDEPMPTVTANSYVKRPGGAAPIGLVDAKIAPLLSKICQNGSNGDCTASIEKPLGTVVSKNEHLLIAPTLVGAGGPEYSAKPREVDRPLGSMTAEPRAAAVAAFLAHLAHGDGKTGRFANGTRASAADSPLGTVHAGGGNFALTTAFIAKHFGKSVGESANGPLGTVTSNPHHDAVAANLIHLNHGEKQWSGVDEPARTTSGNHAALVYSFLVKYFGTAIGVEVDSPLPTATGKDRFGVVLVYVDGEPYVIVDIGMRMLKPFELGRAQGFGPDTILTGTATSQVARIGNSVPPDLAAAVVGANVEMAVAA